jgi:Tol biopolymer transport system component
MPAHPEVGGVVLYTCFPPSPANGGRLFLLDVTTGKVRALTSDGAWNIDAAWSPDGDRIAYQSTRDGRSDLYVMDVDSGRVRRLTDGRGFNGYPTWSPDGQWIAFESSRDGIRKRPQRGFYRDLYLVRAEGTEIRRLAPFLASNSEPAWSPDGDRIAFDSDQAGATDVYTMTPGGFELHQLTHLAHSGGFATYPRWSPDGSRVVFDAAPTAAGHSSLYWMLADGGEVHQVTNDATAQWDGWPDWSDDGRWIVFTRNGQSEQLFAVAPDGSDVTQLTDDAGSKVLPRWRPR